MLRDLLLAAYVHGHSLLMHVVRFNIASSLNDISALPALMRSSFLDVKLGRVNLKSVALIARAMRQSISAATETACARDGPCAATLLSSSVHRVP